MTYDRFNFSGEELEVLFDTVKPLKKVAKRGRRLTPVSPNTETVRKSQVQIEKAVHAIFKKVAFKLAAQIRATAKKKVQKAEGDEEGDAVDAATVDQFLTVDISDFNALASDLPDWLTGTYQDAGVNTLAVVGAKYGEDVVNQVNQRALDYAQARAAELVGMKWVDGELVDNPNAEWAITDSTRDMVAATVNQALDEGWGVQGLANALEAMTTDEDTFQPFSAYRAKMVARTETLDAHGQGALDGYKQAKAIGVAVQKAWSPGPEACPICLENADAGPIDVDDVFPSGDDAPTAHPNCECSLIPVVDDSESDTSDNTDNTDTSDETDQVEEAARVRKYSEDQPRDESGRWAGGGSSTSGDPHGTPSGGGGAFRTATAQEFVTARDQSVRAAFLSSHGADELQGYRLFLSADGKTGFALDPQGDLQNLFNNGAKGEGGKALVEAIRQGATTLDCFDPFLPALYAKYGFVPTGRMAFNDQYAPAGWNYGRDQRPDVVFMAYQGGPRDQIAGKVGSFPVYNGGGKLYSDYAEAKRDASAAVVAKFHGRGRTGHDGAAGPARRRGSLFEALGILQGATGLYSDLVKYSPDQARDDHGRFGEGSSGKKPLSEKLPGGVKVLAGEEREREYTSKLIMDRVFTPDQLNTVQDLAQKTALAMPESGTYTAVVEGIDKNPDRVRVSVSSTDNKNGAELIFYRSNGELNVENHLFSLNKDEQGKGVGRAVTAAQLEAYEKLGVGKIDLFANIDAGGYVWAQAGFRPYSDPSRDQFGKSLAFNLAEVGFSLEDQTTIGNLYKMVQTEHWSDRAYYMANLEYKGERIGRKILGGTGWDGRLDLHDPVQNARLKEFIAGSGKFVDQPVDRATKIKGVVVYYCPRGGLPDGAVDGSEELLPPEDSFPTFTVDDLTKLRKYSPDQPRDERGRFGSGDGGTEAGSKQNNPLSDAEVKSWADAVAGQMGYDENKIEISHEPKTFELNGKTLNYAGAAYLDTGRIVLWPDQIPRGSVVGIAAHEIEHQRWQSVLNAYEKERDGLMRGGAGHGEPTNFAEYDKYYMPNGIGIRSELYDEFKAKYPFVAALNQDSGRALPDGVSGNRFFDTRVMAKDDGVTPYSREWWTAYHSGSATAVQAYHETLAEMAMLETQGRLQEASPVWQRFYSTVNDLYNTHIRVKS